MFHIYDLQKKPDGLSFAEELHLEELLQERNSDILAVSPVSAIGNVRFEAGFYFLDYTLSYEVTLASSRSMKPVCVKESYPVQEIFVEDEASLKHQDMVEADLVLIIEGDSIDLTESVADNILLHIPLQVLTPEEAAGEELPSGTDWSVLTEEQFAQQVQEKKQESNPFAQLQGLFDEE